MEWGKTAFAVTVLMGLLHGCVTMPADHYNQIGDYDRLIDLLSRQIASAENRESIPPLLLKRGQAHLAVGLKMGGNMKPDQRARYFAKYGAEYLGAMSDFETIVKDFPGSPEAPEAQYSLGLVYDYPYLTNFGLALSFYRETILKYPGTEAARKAQERINLIEDIKKGLRGTPHGSGRE